MDEFFSIGSAPMSSDETAKIEPTVTDAPPIAPEAATPAAEPAAPKTEAPHTEAPKADAAPEPPKIEGRAEPEKIAPKIEPKAEPKIEAPTLPPAPQIAESPVILRLRRQEPKPTPSPAPSRSRGFALLAGCVAIAASFGAIGGSLGGAKIAPMFAAAPPPPVVVNKDHVGDE